MPYMHAFDAATGRLMGLCPASAPDPGRSAPTQEEAWEAAGLSLATGASQDADGLAVSPESHNYLGGELSAKTLVLLSPDKSEIAADGQDQAVVSVSVDAPEPPASIELTVGGQSEVVALLGGVGALSPIAAATPCFIEVRLADEVAYAATPVIIKAVSQ
ncbi:MAG: hypothetical protein KQH53_11315 [Desulfarculaceae bacterium]|nr:hypothetical protein [Desulfarculaceae bacterium]